MRYIQEFHEGDRFSQVFLCKQKTVATTKAGKSYYSLILQDRTGALDGKIWELNNAIGHFEAKDFIQVDGEVTSYNNALQANIKRVRKANPGEYDPSDYFPVSPKNIDLMYTELLGFINSISNPKMKELAESFFVNDKDFVTKFKSHSAAKSMHHGFIGGLLHHTLSVTKLCDFYCTQYPELNRDLLICAAMFHDIGKVNELSAFPENDYTDDGQLLGHIVIGCEMIGERIKAIPGFPAKTASELRHCILAHHGEYEYGSPKKPAIMEALALNFADNTDAKIEIMVEALANTEGEWTGFNRVMDSNIRKTSPLQ